MVANPRWLEEEQEKDDLLKELFELEYPPRDDSLDSPGARKLNEESRNVSRRTWANHEHLDTATLQDIRNRISHLHKKVKVSA